MKHLLTLILLTQIWYYEDALALGLLKEKEQLIRDIQKEVGFSSDYLGISKIGPEVINAILKTPREEFVPLYLRKNAYANRPLSIGHGQTISQPLIVAIMTELLSLTKSDKVLEIGTGSGYQAAVLSHLAAEVHTIEIIPELAQKAKRRLEKLNYKNIYTYTGDGYLGLREHSPYDAIIVTAAASHIPPPLIKQLRPGGRMIIPVGGPYQIQNLNLIIKTSEGIKSKSLIPVRFVPLTREKR